MTEHQIRNGGRDAPTRAAAPAVDRAALTVAMPSDVSAWLSLLARASLALLGAAYAAGFLVVFSYSASLSLPPVSALSVRHLAAGLLFLFFVVQAGAIAWWWHWSMSFWGRGIASALLEYARVESEIAYLGSRILYDTWRKLPLLPALLTRDTPLRRLVAALPAHSAHGLLGLTTASATILGALLLLLLWPLALSLFTVATIIGPEGWPGVPLWMAVTAPNFLGFFLLFRHMCRGKQLSPDAALSMLIAFIWLAVGASLFGRTIYPEVPPQFGGGMPTQVLLVLDGQPPRDAIPALAQQERAPEGLLVRGRLLSTTPPFLTLLPDGSDTAVTFRCEDIRTISHSPAPQPSPVWSTVTDIIRRPFARRSPRSARQ